MAKTEVRVFIKSIFDSKVWYAWDHFCETYRQNEYMFRDGKADETDTVLIDIKEAAKWEVPHAFTERPAPTTSDNEQFLQDISYKLTLLKKTVLELIESIKEIRSKIDL